jgi:hypothetical protein
LDVFDAKHKLNTKFGANSSPNLAQISKGRLPGGTRKGNNISDVFDATHKLYEAIKAHSKPCVRHSPEAS